jgi:hypothetical protein
MFVVLVHSFSMKPDEPIQYCKRNLCGLISDLVKFSTGMIPDEPIQYCKRNCADRTNDLSRPWKALGMKSDKTNQKLV